MMKDPLSPLRGNAFIKAKIDAEEAGKTSFSFNGKNYPLKMEAESPLNDNHPGKVKLMGEETTEIKKDKKGEYSIVDPDDYNIQGINTGDTIRPASGKRFNPNKTFLYPDGTKRLGGGEDFDWVRTDENNIKLKK